MKVLNCCLLKLFSITTVTAASIEALLMTFEARLGEGREVAESTRRARAIRAAVGSAAVPPPLSVLVVIHALTDANLRAVVVAPVTFCGRKADEVVFDVTLEFEARQHFLIRHFVVTAGVGSTTRCVPVTRRWCTGFGRCCRDGRFEYETAGMSSPSSCALAATERRAWVCHSWLTQRFSSFDAGIERRIGRIDAVDRVSNVPHGCRQRQKWRTQMFPLSLALISLRSDD